MQSDLPFSSPQSTTSPYQSVGAGSFGVVSRCQAPDGNLVALKTATDACGAFISLRREDALLRSLCLQADGTACPYVPLVYGLVTSPTQPTRLALAMEYIEGQSLADWLAERIPTVQDLEQVTTQLVILLLWLERKRVLHHDLSPANIMRRPDGSLVLIDFGLAERLPSFGDSGDQPVGTPGYIAPERQNGIYGVVTFQSDLYSAGCFLDELLCFIEETEQHSLLLCWKEVIEALLYTIPFLRADVCCLQQAHQRLYRLRMTPPHSGWGWLVRWHLPWRWWRMQSFIRQSRREMTCEVISLLHSLKNVLHANERVHS